MDSQEATELESELTEDQITLFVADSDAWSSMRAAEVVPLIRRRGVLEWMRVERMDTAKYFDHVARERQSQ